MKRITFGLVLGLLALAGLVLGSAAQAATPCADLVVDSVTSVPAQPVMGQPSTIAVTVRNAGTCAAGGFGVQLRPDILAAALPTAPVVGLDVGATTVANFPVLLPAHRGLRQLRDGRRDEYRRRDKRGEQPAHEGLHAVAGVDLVVSGVSAIRPCRRLASRSRSPSPSRTKGPTPRARSGSTGARRSVLQRFLARSRGSAEAASTTVTIPFAYRERRCLRQPRDGGRRQQCPGDERVQQREVVPGERDAGSARSRDHGRAPPTRRTPFAGSAVTATVTVRNDGARCCGELRRTLAAVAARGAGHDADRRPRDRRVGDRQPELAVHLHRDV